MDEKDLVANLDMALSISSKPLDIGKILETDDISALFGLDMAETGGATPGHDAIPTVPEPVARIGQKQTSRKVAGRKAVVRSRPAPAARKANPHAVLPARQIRKTCKPSKASKASKAPHSAEPIAQARPLDDSPIRKASKRAQDPKIAKGKGKRTMPKPEIELTPDGFVKWWT